MSWENQLPVLFHNGSIESQIDRLLDDAIQSVNRWPQSLDPAYNMFEDEQDITVQIALPGLDVNQIDVQVENNILRVKGERKDDESEGRQWYTRGIEGGAFSCSLSFPNTRTMRNRRPHISKDFSQSLSPNGKRQNRVGS